MVSINVKTFDMVLSSEKSATGFFSFILWARWGFIKVLCDEFVSFGVHNFMQKKLVGNFELILFCDVR